MLRWGSRPGPSGRTARPGSCPRAAPSGVRCGHVGHPPQCALAGAREGQPRRAADPGPRPRRPGSETLTASPGRSSARWPSRLGRGPRAFPRGRAPGPRQGPAEQPGELTSQQTSSCHSASLPQRPGCACASARSGRRDWAPPPTHPVEILLHK